MASGPAPPVAVPPAAMVSADKVIDSQLGRVRRHIRVTDLIAGVMVLLAGALAFLLLMAIVDHWIVGLGVVGRCLALLILIAGAGWHLAANVLPLLLRRINPAYAAQTIERGQPAMKNSLLNYLLLRRGGGVPASIYQAVQHRAAVDVARVEVEQTVDRTVLIRAGYVLAGMMAFLAAYKILSPKDPFQTVRRIANPWSDIARPARVTIESVEPGNADVVQGQTVEVSAIVRGERLGEDVRLICSSVDRQIVDQTVAMKPDSSGLRHVALLPPGDSAQVEAGVLQDFVYRIEAGDAVSAEFRLRVVAAPIMTVESVEYDYPAYTGRARDVVERQGDLRAVEGTRVTVRARANQPIRSAAIELSSSAAAIENATSERLTMQFQETDAWCQWNLQLTADRQAPKFTAYRATFSNQQGVSSRHPVTYRIEVIPDLPPEVEILTPNKTLVEVPLSGEQRIEVRAVDPDFGISSLRLKAVCAERQVLDQPLIEESSGRAGQIVAGYVFRPRDLQLTVGSQVTYWAVAADNRHTDSSPEPNTSRTVKQTLVVVEDPAGRPDQPSEKGTEDKTSDKSDDPKSEPSNPSQPKDSNQEKSEKGSPESGSGQGDSSKQAGGGQSDKGESSQEKSSDQQKGGGKGGSGQQQPGQSGQPQRGGNAKNQPSTSQPGQGATGQQPGGDTSQDAEPRTQPGQTSPGKDPSATGELREGNKPGQRTEPLHDGEVFEKTLERLNNERSTSPNADPPNANQPSEGARQPKPGNDRPADPNEAPQGDEKSGGASADAKSGEKKKSEPNAGSGRESPDRKRPPSSGDEAKQGEKGQGEKKQGSPTDGQSGAGQKSGEQGGGGQTPAPRERPMQQQPDAGSPQPGEPPPPNQSERQSDSKGQESGDRSGGGKKGSGQGAKQPGQDNAGSTTPSDDGEGAAPEPGAGDTGKSPGNQQPSTAPQPGSPGSQKGPGSQSKSDPRGKQPGSSDPTGQPPTGDQSPSSGSGSPGKSPATSGQPTGGGVPGDLPPGSPPPTGDIPPGDAANLEYARRATDMVLEYLKDQQDKPSDELLDELGWTAEDLKAFLQRWQALKRSAAEDADARRDLDDSLRGLGLRPQTDSRRAGGARSDDVRGLRESGIKSSPPSSYQEQFNAFKKGAARSQP